MMNQKKLPSLSAIVAFDAVVRLGTFTKAAEELHLTQGAISKQIKRLEISLGFNLFERKGSEIRLTSNGAELYSAVTHSLQSIKDAITRIDDNNRTSVVIQATNAIAGYLVLPLVSAYRRKNPGTRVSVVASDDQELADFSSCDLAVIYGNGDWPGLNSLRIADEEIFAVCSNDYKSRMKISDIHDLSRCDLIEIAAKNSATISTRRWMKEVGYLGEYRGAVTTVSNYDLAIKAALAGDGVTLVWGEAQPPELLSNKLVRVCEHSLKTGSGEYIAYPKSHPLSPAAHKLWSWIADYYATIITK